MFSGARRKARITGQYLEEEAPIVRERLKRAGVRLGAILNGVSRIESHETAMSATEKSRGIYINSGTFCGTCFAMGPGRLNSDAIHVFISYSRHDLEIAGPPCGGA